MSQKLVKKYKNKNNLSKFTQKYVKIKNNVIKSAQEYLKLKYVPKYLYKFTIKLRYF